MPTYEFRNKETGETFEQLMKISERETFLETHPELEQVHLTPPINSFIDPIRLSRQKVPGGFKEVLRDIHHRTPGSQLDKVADV